MLILHRCLPLFLRLPGFFVCLLLFLRFPLLGPHPEGARTNSSVSPWGYGFGSSRRLSLVDSVWGHRAPNAEGHGGGTGGSQSAATPPRQAYKPSCASQHLRESRSPPRRESFPGGRTADALVLALVAAGRDSGGPPGCHVSPALADGGANKGGTPRSSQRCAESPARCCHSIAIVTARTVLPCSRHCPHYDGHRFY